MVNPSNHPSLSFTLTAQVVRLTQLINETSMGCLHSLVLRKRKILTTMRVQTQTMMDSPTRPRLCHHSISQSIQSDPKGWTFSSPLGTSTGAILLGKHQPILFRQIIIHRVRDISNIKYNFVLMLKTRRLAIFSPGQHHHTIGLRCPRGHAVTSIMSGKSLNTFSVPLSSVS